ncbi:hypothetical protein [Gilliamella sp. BG7]|uniref:hypothetical protein n=1 Tax=unclassified Gilliamella TaxID=2685620 RepID=UPI003987A0B2
MQNSVRTVVSLTVNIVKILDLLVVELKKKTSYKVNKSKLIRVSILYLSSYEEDKLKKVLVDFKQISKWQTNKLAIKEVTVTLNKKCYYLLELMSKIDVGYKIYKSGLIRLAIIRFSEEENFEDIFLNLVEEL